MAARRHNPFFEMLPDWALMPMVVLATAATVIASQAVISGAYSLARQAVQLNILPRFEMQHTSETQSGQIYMPRVNLLLALGVMLLVVGFGESSTLASAYGISVTGEMLVTTILLFVVMRRIWKWPLAGRARADARCSASSTSASLPANAVKVARGRLGVDRASPAMMVPDHGRPGCAARRYLFDKTRKNEIPLDFLAEQIDEEAAAAGAGHGGVPDQRPAQRADRADAQPEALQGAARAERHPVGGHGASSRSCPTANGSRWRRSTSCSCG